VHLWVGAAAPEDRPALAALLQAARLPAEGLATHLDTCLVARDGDRVVGVAAIEVYGPAGFLRSVAVETAYQRQGLGRRLAEAARDLARHHRVRTIYLLTRRGFGLFASLGFTRVSRGDVALAVRESVNSPSGDWVAMQLVIG